MDILIKGMIVQSGNDATVALAERVAGTEDAFVQVMNEYARRLGMAHTHFSNAAGLPTPITTPPPATWRCWRSTHRRISGLLSAVQPA